MDWDCQARVEHCASCCFLAFSNEFDPTCGGVCGARRDGDGKLYRFTSPCASLNELGVALEPEETDENVGTRSWQKRPLLACTTCRRTRYPRSCAAVRASGPRASSSWERTASCRWRCRRRS